MADQEDDDHNQNHLDGLIAFKVTSLTKGLDDAAVTQAHGQERKDKGQNNLARLDGDAERVRNAGVRGAGVVDDSGVLHIWYGED